MTALRSQGKPRVTWYQGEIGELHGPDCRSWYDRDRHGVDVVCDCQGESRVVGTTNARKQTLAEKAEKRWGISPASPAQRDKCAGARCVVCGSDQNIDPAHLIDRSLGGDDDPLAVLPICRKHHRDYDEGGLSLLEYLEPDFRDEVAYAVKTVGLVRALERITNSNYEEVRR